MTLPGELQSTYNGKSTLKQRMWDFFDGQGHNNFTTDELVDRFGCARTAAQRYRKHWQRQEVLEGPRCSRCGFFGWKKAPILENGLCLWCNLEIEGVDLRLYAEVIGW